MIDKARKHLATSELLQDTDLEIAFDALYTAARLSVTALLATQGLRPTTKGSHVAPIKAVRAQLGVHAKVLRSYDRLRVTRNRTDYPSPGATLSGDDVREGILRAGDIVDVAAGILWHSPPTANLRALAGRSGGSARPIGHQRRSLNRKSGSVQKNSAVQRLEVSAPGGIRTPNLLIRSQMLYPLSYRRLFSYPD